MLQTHKRTQAGFYLTYISVKVIEALKLGSLSVIMLAGPRSANCRLRNNHE
jgi:hypothetical protein